MKANWSPCTFAIISVYSCCSAYGTFQYLHATAFSGPSKPKEKKGGKVGDFSTRFCSQNINCCNEVIPGCAEAKLQSPCSTARPLPLLPCKARVCETAHQPLLPLPWSHLHAQYIPEEWQPGSEWPGGIGQTHWPANLGQSLPPGSLWTVAFRRAAY